MAFQYSASIRNAKLDQIVTTIGASPPLKIFSGPEPVNCAAADPTGLLVTITLPSVWMNAASAGVSTKLGTWSAAASGTGVAASFRIYDSSTNCHIQGAINADMTLDNTSISSGRVIPVNTFSLTAGNA